MGEEENRYREGSNRNEIQDLHFIKYLLNSSPIIILQRKEVPYSPTFPGEGDAL